MSHPHPPTTRFTRRHLPHWEVARGRYFVTVRCADSLPSEAVERLREIHYHLSRIEAHSPEFAAHQRLLFRTIDKYLDAGIGSCPLRDSRAAESIRQEFDALSAWHCTVPHFTIMPSHWHALIVPSESCTHSLAEIVTRIKRRTGHQICRLTGEPGPLWQRECFDRWIRHDAEWQRCIDYIHNNPVKAGLVKRWQDHLWTK